jgi:hypothetical protein
MHPFLGQDFCILLCCLQTHSGAHPVPFTNGTGAFIRGRIHQRTKIDADIPSTDVWNVLALNTLLFGFIYFNDAVLYNWGD